MFTYNFKRLINLIGISLFKKLVNAIKEGNIEAIREEIAAYITHFRLYLDDFLLLFRYLCLLEKKSLYSGREGVCSFTLSKHGNETSPMP